jgi:hypothetical protein
MYAVELVTIEFKTIAIGNKPNNAIQSGQVIELLLRCTALNLLVKKSMISKVA